MEVMESFLIAVQQDTSTVPSRGSESSLQEGIDRGMSSLEEMSQSDAALESESRA